MKRTWKDAACEVAWNRIQKYRCKFTFTAFCPLGTLQETTPSVIFTRVGFVIPPDFPAFRAAFMRWLDENEVKN